MAHQESRNTYKSVKTTEQELAIDSKYKQLTELDSHSSLKRAGKQLQQSDRIIKIGHTYEQGVKKYDAKTQEINRLINGQHENYHRKIRSQFAARKNGNDSTNTRFYSKIKKNIF